MLVVTDTLAPSKRGYVYELEKEHRGRILVQAAADEEANGLASPAGQARGLTEPAGQ